jgi:uncharacterized DUF497 family protein
VRFQWDSKKEESNRRKHGVAFREAMTIFHDPLAATFSDSDHSEIEQRNLTIGHSSHGRLLVVCHTDREESVRIISARVATTRERKHHEEQT